MLDDPDAVVLVVHAAALLAVLDHASAGGGSGRVYSAADVLTGLLGHEARYWHKSARARGLILDPSVERLAVAIACLIGQAARPTRPDCCPVFRTWPIPPSGAARSPAGCMTSTLLRAGPMRMLSGSGRCGRTASPSTW